MNPQLTSGDFWGADPHTALARLRADDPVYWDGTVWGLTRYADVKEASLHPELFSNAGGIRPETPATPMLIDTDDPEHLLRRRLISKGFTPRRIADLRPRVDEITHTLIDRVADRGGCEFVSAIAAWVPLIVIGDLLGVRPEHYDDLLRWSDDMMAVQGQRANPERTARMATALAESRAYFGDVFADRRSNGGEDLLGVLVRAEADGVRLTDDQLYFDALLLLIGGDETTRHVISGGLYQLLSDRSRWERLRADRSLLPGAIEESLRWVSPIRNMARTVTRDVTFRGRAFSAGQKVLLLYPSANRDEDVFADPFSFDITRSPNPHLAFGIGAHFCLGSSLARLELEAVFTALLDRLPDLRLDTPVEPPLRPAMFVSGYEELPVVFG